MIGLGYHQCSDCGLRIAFQIIFLNSSMPPVAYVYILTNKYHTVLYVGMTTDLRTRIWEHQTKRHPAGFSARYNVIKPIFYEPHHTQEEAIERELFIKGKTRKWKEALIISKNPTWNDLTEDIMSMNP